MIPEPAHSTSLIAALPGWLILLLAAAFAAAWIILHRLEARRKRPSFELKNNAPRWAVGVLALWLCLHALSRIVALATNWPWILLALLGATAVEAVPELYRVERKAIKPELGKYLAALRMTAVLLVFLILAQPVIERYVIRTFERYVVILFDQSASMHLEDPQRNAEELLDLAVFYGILNPRDFEEAPESVEQLLAAVTPQQRERIEAIAKLERRQIANRVLAGEDRDGLAAGLGRRYEVRRVDFAATPRIVEDQGEDEDSDDLVAREWRQLTNLSAALEYPLENFPPEQLAGVILISDARDTAGGHAEGAAIQLGLRAAPVYPLLIGSRQPRLDLAVVGVDAPEDIFKGERLRAEARLKLYGVAGREVKVVFKRENQEIDTRAVSVPEDNDTYRTTVEFNDEPETDGIHAYSVEIEPVADEAVTENNAWRFQTAVSEDRTNVLLIDHRPRWEFRYLRNLFYGRDKSVHLQYVLSRPDTIAFPDDRQPEPRPPVVASASRPFGEAEADRLPALREEWRKFDVIIIGDVPPQFLTETMLEHIEHCVNERGTALIVIAGPNYMPHKFDSPILQRLLPVEYTTATQSFFASPEPVFRLQPTMEGRQHPIMRLAPSLTESERLWSNLPNLQWRYAEANAKPAATVLAYAQPPRSEIDEEFVVADRDPGDTSRRIRELSEVQRRNSLIVAHQFGLGRVLMFNFDRTWRLRYRVGDLLHHRFWRQIMTWGAGENLRAGSQFVRLGTDRITYSPEDPVRVAARVLRPNYTPVLDDRIALEVFHEQARIATHTMRYRPQSQGMYDVEIGPFAEPGRYRIALSGSTADQIVEWEEAGPVETEFLVATAYNPVEIGEFSVDHKTADRIAAASGGEIVTPRYIEQLNEAFGPGSEGEPQRADITIWDHWLILLALLALLTAEWLLRRKGGLP